MLPAPLHVPFRVNDPCQDLGAAEVDADDTFFAQTARLPYWLDGDGREALPRLPGRTGQGQGAAGAHAGAAARSERAQPTPAQDPPTPPALELEAAHRPWTDRPARRDGGMGNRGLPRLSER